MIESVPIQPMLSQSDRALYDIIWSFNHGLFT